jgi:hypothetical protein
MSYTVACDLPIHVRVAHRPTFGQAGLGSIDYGCREKKQTSTCARCESSGQDRWSQSRPPGRDLCPSVAAIRT